MTRQEFADILQNIIVPEGTPQEGIDKAFLPISEAVVKMMPEHLFRYRNCSPLNIDAFEQDKVYGVTANKFNDPYDCLVKYDVKHIKDEIDLIITKENYLKMTEYLKKRGNFPISILQNIPQEEYKQMISYVISRIDTPELENYIQNLRECMKNQINMWLPILAESNKRYSTIACFSETISSVTMWSHYANYHKGFALEYNLRPLLAHGIRNVGVFPVIYSNERHDATSYIQNSLYNVFGLQVPAQDITEVFKCALYKATDWEYEKEWRLINTTPRTNVFQEECSNVSLKPVAIYYGQKMSFKEKQKLHNIAKKKGIAEYEMYIDYSSGKYEMLYRKYQSI